MPTILESPPLEPINTPGGAHQALPQCFGPKMGRFLDSTFAQLFEEQVAIGHSRLAVVAGSDRLTYGELNARANQLAHHLRALGAGRETLVGICIDRSWDMAVGVLAILKSGAAYLPIDPDYPSERLRWMLEDSGVSLVVTQEKLAAKLSGCESRLIALDTDCALIAQQPQVNLLNGPKPDELAYVIYTSGSTGEPKGVMITHESLANYVLALNHELQIDHDDRYLHTASISFSSSRRQLLLPLSQGAAVVIASAAQRKDSLALFEMIKGEGVTVMDAVPSFWRSCTAILETLPGDQRARLLDNRLRLMLSASEPLLSDIPRTWMNKFRHRARHVHMFGQTETAGIVCLQEIHGTGKTESDADIGVVPVGRPIANTEIYILDEQQQPVAVGSPGELYIGGAGLGRGYLARPELTAAKFVPHPFTETAGARLYRTGDWARWRADGAIEFAGRQDSQVKLRGFRVELQEIEAVLARHAAIAESVVVAKDDGGTKRLVAYFVTNSQTCSVSELRKFLSKRLPDYMVPSTFVQLTALPLNVNGKVNRRALPEPGGLRPQLATPYLAPQTKTENLLATIWSSVLRINQVGIDDDFFELGGHSLLAMQVVARINQRMQVALPLRELFEGPTLRQLARKIDSTAICADSSSQVIPIIARTQAPPLSFAQRRLWFLDQLEPGSPLYNINRALRLRGTLDVSRLKSALQSIAMRHEALRTTFVEVDGLPVQRIASPSDATLPFELHDLRSVSEVIREQEVQRLLTIESEKSFHLACGPLARVTILRSAEDEYVLLLSIHHIIADAWSIGLFFQELASSYLNEESQLPVLRAQYADFAEWQRKGFDSGALSDQLAYWKQQLADAPLVLDLPTDRARPALLGSEGAKRTLPLGEELRQSLRSVSRQEGVTLFMLLMAAFQVLLARYSQQDDILVGTPVAGRTLVDTEALIGCFINTLVLRADLSGNPSLRDLIKRTRERAIGAFTHQDVPFEKLVEELRPDRSLSRSPIFQVMFVVQDETKPEFALPGIRVTPIEIDTATAKFELALGVVERAEGMDAWLSYNTDLFESSSIAAMLVDFKSILESMVRDREQKLSDLPEVSWISRLPREGKSAGVSFESEPARREFVAPRTPVEERLAGIWSEVLRVETVGVHDSFFELGGHSLLAAQVISRARNIFSAELTLRRLFETPTIAGLAEAIYEIQTAETEDDELEAMLAELSQLTEEEAEQRVANG